MLNTTHPLKLLFLFTTILSCSFACTKPKQKPRLSDLPYSPEALASIPYPRGQEVCFSPDDRCDLKLLKLLDGAQTSIDIAIFDLNLPALVQLLLLKSKTMRLRVVADRRQAKGNYSRISELVDAGLPVRFGRQRGIFHHKFVIVDGKTLETGSFNFTRHASQANQENQLYLTSPEILARYRAQFEHMWMEAKPAASEGAAH